MPPSPRDPVLLRLASARHESLLKALLSEEEFRYEDLSRLTGKTDAALKTQFSRWQNLGLDLLEKVGTMPAEGKGRPTEIFRLIPARRQTVRTALDRILAERQPDDGLRVVDTLPQLDDIETLLRGWIDEETDLSVRYYSTQSARSKLTELGEFLRSTDHRMLGFKPSTSLLERIEIRSDDVRKAIDSVRELIERKRPEVASRMQSVKRHVHDGQLDGYFDEIPLRSVSGFGGALMARAESAECAMLDDYLQSTFVSHKPLGARIRSGFSHVMSEIVELARIDAEWRPMTETMFDGAAICAPLAELPSLRRSAGASAAAEATGDQAPPMAADSEAVDEDTLERSIGRLGLAQTPRGTAYDLFRLGDLFRGLDDALLPAAG